MKTIGIFFILFVAFNSFSATVAVIDSGVDVSHQDLKNNLWTNTNEIPNNNRDEDGNGYQDDIFGWNFAEDNNKVIDYSYLGTLDDNIKKFFAIQGKSFTGDITDEEKEWVKSILKNEEFIKKITIYGNFMHGTHVSGIAAKDSKNMILAVKLIPTEIKLPGESDDKGIRISVVKFLLKQIAKQQANAMAGIVEYIDGHNTDVANGSFGTGYPQAKAISKAILDALFKRELLEKEINEVAMAFLNETVKANTDSFNLAPDILFVFAAGNDSLNNDEFPISPANVKLDNTLTVAATFGELGLAVFSNYGNENVDIAAPGVNILSAVPGNKHLRVSGTSQAAPYVANIAGQIKTTNPNLTPKEIKEIIIKTGDVKDYLKGKVKSSSIINPSRAITTAELSLTMDIESAIGAATTNVVALNTHFDLNNNQHILPEQNLVLPLTSLFKVIK